MGVLPFVLAAWLFCVGLYGMVTSRNFFHLAICLTVMQSSSYVLLLEIGYRKGGTAPIFYDVPLHTKAVDPIVQSLTLTDIVVGVTLLALFLSLGIQAHKRSGTLDPSDLRPMKG